MSDVKTPRFGSGEGKGEISESVRGDDIYLMVDVCNHSMTYTYERIYKPHVPG